MKSEGRLGVICSLIERAEIIADVGCDHGLVAKYCVDNRLGKKIIASDVSPNSLKSAESLLGEIPNVSILCCDGIAYKCDEAVIAGMGGLLICEILNKAACLPETLVLCPHRDAYELRKTLIGLGYGIDRDVPVVERGKYYFVIRARRGGGVSELSELQMLYGLDIDKKNEVISSWLLKQYDTYKVAPLRNAERLENIRAALELQGVQQD